jgi:MSHA biogenesis protein MshN
MVALMSVINKMLKDLDKRGSNAGDGNTVRGVVRSVPDGDDRARPLIWIVFLLVAVLGGALAWLLLDEPLPMVKPEQTLVISSAPSLVQSAPAPVEVSPPPAVVPATPTTPSEQASAVVPITPPVVTAQAVEDKKIQPPPAIKSEVTTQKQERPAAAKSAKVPVPDEGAVKLALSNSLSIPPAEAQQATAPTVRVRGKRGATHDAALMSKETTPEQRADNAYGKAISLIDSGQKAEAIGVLESLLVQNPKHASARQTLVGLLLDAKRTADAIRVLQEGLKLDPARTGMAMLLARVQVENGDTKAAIASLQKSLPYAARTPDYQAFLAALFQREKRHGEAIEHYRIALRLVPSNGVWWMGYGISLQAEGKSADARNAFIQAKDSGRLTPELQAFVEQRINQLK